MTHQGGQAWCQEAEAASNTAGKSGGRWRNMDADVEHIFLSFMGLRSYPKRWSYPQRSGSSSLPEPFWKFHVRHSHGAKSSQVNYQNQLRGTLQDGTLSEWPMRGEADSVLSSIRTEDHGLSDLKQKCVSFASWQTEAWNLVNRAGLAWVLRKNPLQTLFQASERLKFLLFLGLQLPDSSLSPPSLVWPAVSQCWSPLQMHHLITPWSGLICKSLIPSFQSLVLYNVTYIDPRSQSWMDGTFYAIICRHSPLWEHSCLQNPGTRWTLGTSWSSLCAEAGGHCWVSSSITLPLFVRHCLSLQLELADLARPPGKDTPDIHLSLSPQFWG